MNDIEHHRLQRHLTAARAGDASAFAELVREHHARVWRFILKQVHNPADAEELAQETFLAAWRGLGSFQGNSRFSTWLLGIALNLSRNHCNRSPGRHEATLPEGEHLDALLVDENDPAERVHRKQLLRALDRALARLPQELRETTLLVRLEGLSMEEAAELLAIPAGTVKSRLSRARSLLLQSMAAHAACEPILA